MKRIFLFLSAVSALCLVGGCAELSGQTKDLQASRSTAKSLSPKDELDEQRMEEAVRGLVFDAGLIRVPNSKNDRIAGERLRVKADRSIEEENVWFHSVGYFRDALLADANNYKTYEGLARAFLMEGEASRAEPALRTALQMQPKFSAARYELGLVRQMLSDYAGAVSQWKILTQHDPNYSDVYARMAIASYYDQDFDGAKRYLAEADRRHQNVPPQFRGLLQEAVSRQ